MSRSEQPVPDGPLSEFAEGLRALRRSEKLTYRQLSQRARYSYSVLSTAASGRAMPTLAVTLAYVGACRGDTEEWEERWKSVAAVLRANDAGLPPEARESAAMVDAGRGAPRPATEDWGASIEPPDHDGPRRIGVFRILGRLGAGATGEVYLAASPSGRATAVKVIRPQFARDPLFCRRFAKELATARKVGGAHTAAVIAADAHAERPWMASEYLPGPSLAQVVENQGPLPGPVVLNLAAGICEALSAFRAVGVVHRDLKPTNVLLTEQGPKVIDFGIARCPDGTALTAAGALIGTAGFMAPEQVEGGQITPAADVFALGCVLAYAVTGRAPFGDGASASMLYRVVHDEPDEEALACDHEQLRDLIGRCLSKRPESRPTPEQIIDECARSTRAGLGWLPDSVAAQVARLNATATALVKRAERRRAVRRALAVSTVFLTILAITATMAVLDSGGTSRVLGVPGGRHAGHTPTLGVAEPRPTATTTLSALPGSGAIVPAARDVHADATNTAIALVTDSVGPLGPSFTTSASAVASPQTPVQTVYPPKRSTYGWRPITRVKQLAGATVTPFDLTGDTAVAGDE